MSEVHTTTSTGVVVHIPGVSPTNKGVGQAVVVAKDVSGKVTSVSGTVAGVTHNNPA
jgi:hypothetical protein